MRVLHTSDWHLGKKLFKAQRLEEQSLFLNWLMTTIKTNNIDVLIVAGDIFDVPSPPNNAQTLFFDFIHKLKSFEDLHIIIISGNHDSSSLLKIPEPFFKEQNCHIITGLPLNSSESDVVITKGDETVAFKALPYFRNFELLNQIPNDEDEEIEKFRKYFKNYFDTWKQDLNKEDKKFLIAHHVFGNYEMSGSEHAIHLSGMDHFPLSWVQDSFDYVALGHIHKKMVMSQTPPIIYPGSPIPMRFSEKGDKYVALIETKAEKLEYELVKIPVFRSLIQLKVNLENYVQKVKEIVKDHAQDKLTAYLELHVQLDSPSKGLADKMRALLVGSNIELLSYIPQMKREQNDKSSSELVSRLDITELFKNYYQQSYPDTDVPKAISESFNELLEDVRREDT